MGDGKRRIVEDALDPARPIIDPHHHFFAGPAAGRFAHPRYMFDDLLADIRGGHNIQATVYIQCGSMYRAFGPEHLRPVGETEFANGMAAMAASGQYGECRVCAGIVAAADLTLGHAVDDVLNAHIAASPLRMRGIRHGAYWHENTAIHDRSHVMRPLLDDAVFRQGVARVGAFGLSYETWIYHTQLDEFRAFAQALPEVTLVVDHLAGPIGTGPYHNKRREVFEIWKKGMTTLATCPNVFIKLGGLYLSVCGYDWDQAPTPVGSAEIARQTRDYFLTAIDLFGPNRCMFESNAPVDTVAYGTLWNVFKRMTQDFSESDKAQLFHDTAARAYRLDTA